VFSALKSKKKLHKVNSLNIHNEELNYFTQVKLISYLIFIRVVDLKVEFATKIKFHRNS